MRSSTGIKLIVVFLLSFFVSKGVQASLLQQQPKVVPTPSVSSKPCATKKPTIVTTKNSQVRKDLPAWANDIINEETETNNESHNPHRSNNHYNLPHFSVLNFLSNAYARDTVRYKASSYVPNKQSTYKKNNDYRI